MSLQRPGIIRQHKPKPNFIIILCNLLVLGGFLQEKDQDAQYFVTDTLEVLFHKAHQNFPQTLVLIAVKKSEVIKSCKPLIRATTIINILDSDRRVPIKIQLTNLQ